MKPLMTSFFCGILLLVACQGGDPNETTQSPGDTDVDPSTTAGTTQDPDSSSSSWDEGGHWTTSGSTIFDSSGGGGVGGSTTEWLPDTDTDATTGGVEYDFDPIVGCTKVDFLFVMDSHTGGNGALNAMKHSLDNFVAHVTQQLGEQDLHFMVVDTDDQWGSEPCEEACLLYGSCESNNWSDYPCDFETNSCDEQWGAGIVFPSGSDIACNVELGARYMNNQAPDTLKEDLWCLLNVGSHGNGLQKQAKGLYSALEPFNTDPGQCNEGFLRPEAVLVIVLVTQLPDLTSEDEPADWYQKVLSAKAGDASSIVVLGLLDDSDAPDNVCDQPFMDPEKRLSTFINSFEFGLEESVCSTHYGSHFDAMFELVQDACSLHGQA